TAVVGAEYRDLPDTLAVAVWADQLAAQPASAETLFGIRVDYVVGQSATKSVLWHGALFNGDRTSPLPWGRAGATAAVLAGRAARERRAGGDGSLSLALTPYAPAGWAAAGRQAIVSFWMDSAGPGSQARFVLG